jgi:hypothetical protein
MAEEQSHREEMSAAIRAQRERQGTAKQPKQPVKPPRVSLVSRLRGK